MGKPFAQRAFRGAKTAYRNSPCIGYEPKVVLADEPTGALDSTTSQSVMDLLKEINAEGMTVFVITHEEDIAAQTDRIVRLWDGIITSDEKTKQIEKV